MDIVTKKCANCGEVKDLSHWARNKTKSDGLASYCKECVSAYHKNYVKTYERKPFVYNPETYRKYRYKLSPIEYESLLTSQGGVCAICGGDNGERNRPLYIDHNHETKEVRGLLCAHCNSGLGYFRDNPELLVKASEYLRLFSC